MSRAMSCLAGVGEGEFGEVVGGAGDGEIGELGDGKDDRCDMRARRPRSLRRTAEAVGLRRVPWQAGHCDEFGVLHAFDGAVGVDFGFEHGVEARGVEVLAAFRHAAVAAAFGAPAVRGVEGEEAGIEFLEGLVAGRAARFGGEEDELFVGGEEFEQTFADFEGAGDVSAE